MTAFVYLRHLVAFALRRNRALYFYIVAALLSAVCEIAAMTSLIPLSTLATNGALDPRSKSTRLLAALGIAPTLKSLVLIFLGLFALRILTNVFSQGLALRLGKRIHAQLSSEAFDTVLKFVPVREIEQKSIGSFIGMAGDESFRASMTIIGLSQFVSWFFLSLLYFAAIVVFSGKVALGVAVFLILSAICLGGVFRQSHRLGIRVTQQSRAAGTLFIDALNGLRSTRAFSAESYVSDSYRSQIFQYVHTLFLVDFLQVVARSAPVILLFTICAVVALVLPDSVWARFNIVAMVTGIAFLMRFFPAVGACLNILLKVLSDARAGKDLTTLISDGQRLKSERRDGSPLPSISRVTVRSIDFSYDGKVAVLNDLSFRFERGRSYSIVGPSGTGKSTVVDLLLKFYPMQGGQILIDEEPLQGIPDARLRERVLLLGQNPTIFNDTIRNNIRYGRTATDAEIEQAARLAGIADMIDRLPNRYDSVLQYQGSNLSGGQRQRIALARALLRTPDLLILDESTAALDTETKSQIITNILDVFKDRIVVFITHDAEVWKRTDEVIELRRSLEVEEAPSLA